MYSQAIEESLHHNRAARRVPDGTMEIKDHLRLAEAGREQVPRLGPIDAATCIGDQFALAIVDRKHNASPQESRPGIVADSKPSRRGWLDPALVQIRVPAWAERERQSRRSRRAAPPASF